MPKSHKSSSKKRRKIKIKHSTVMTDIEQATHNSLPVINESLKTVGKGTKTVAEASLPVIEAGVGAVYGTMSSGLDLGVKGVKNAVKKLSGKSRSASRSLALAGGRRTRRRRYRRH